MACEVKSCSLVVNAARGAVINYLRMNIDRSDTDAMHVMFCHAAVKRND
ncbi:hypothetical protein SAMN05428995_102233 [Loktanella sp. DSM 29012]|nr:hypothetical protein SAMN05428995_102233 [Loktanella sp. DSM 29012]